MQGTCIDPDFPYCDEDGSIGGDPGACIAVTCTAGEFSKCDGDNAALNCNSYGTGYDQVQCAHGCDASTGGCRLCEPNQTVCSNGMVASCDENGNQTQPIECPLGCFEDQPRCRDIAPSNKLGTYLDMVASPPDVDMSATTWTLFTSNGVIRDPQFNMLSVPTFLVPQLSGGPPIRVFVVGNLKLGAVTVVDDGTAASSTAVAFLASGTIDVTGPVNMGYSGASHDTACRGQIGSMGYEQANSSCVYNPPGGGGAATAGGRGGIVIDLNNNVARQGGPANGQDALEPLVGGCSGGGLDNSASGNNYAEGSWGGGALQLSSRVAIHVNGQLVGDGSAGGAAHDGGGTYPNCFESYFAGGGGGSFLLEAPEVTLGATARVSVAGGDGYGCSPATNICGLPGKGATGSSAVTPGGDVTFSTALGNQEYLPGVGGGGVGRIRINTPTKTYTADSGSILNGSITTGALSTR